MRFVFLVFDFGFILVMIPCGKIPFVHLEIIYQFALFTLDIFDLVALLTFGAWVRYFGCITEPIRRGGSSLS
jgi:hypothetical protein